MIFTENISSLWIKIVCLSFFILLCWVRGNAQDSTQAHLWWEQAKVFDDSSRYDSAAKYYGLAKEGFLEVAEVRGDTVYWERGIECGVVESTYYMNLFKYDSAISMMKRLYHTSKSDSILFYKNTEIHRIINGIGYAYSMQGSLHEAMYWHKKALEIRTKYLKPKNIYIAHTYNDMANIYIKFNQFDMAIKYYEDAVKILKEKYGEKHLDALKPIANLATVYARMGNFSKASDLTEGILPIFEKSEDRRVSQLASLLSNLGAFKCRIGKYKSGYIFLKKSIALSRKTSDYRNIALGYFQMANEHKSQGFYQKSISYADSAIKYFKLLSFNNSYYLGNCFYVKSLAQKNFGLNDSSIINLNNSKKIFEETYSSDHIIFSDISEVYGLIEIERKRFDLAQVHFVESLGIRENALDQNDIRIGASQFQIGYTYLNEGLLDSAEHYLNKSLQTCLNSQDSLSTRVAIVLINLSRLQVRRQNYLSAINNSRRAINLTNKLRLLLGPEKIQKFVSDQFDLLFSQAVNISYRAHILFPDTTFDELSFTFSEQSKANELSKKIRQSEIFFKSPIPDVILKEEYELRVNLTYFEKKVRENQITQHGDSAALSRYNEKFLFSQRAYDSLLQVLETQYPDYYNLKYNSSVISVKEVQQQLAPDQALLEYLVGDSSLFVFVIRPDTYVVKKVFRDSLLDEHVQAFSQSMYPCSNRDSLHLCNEESQLQTYRHLGHQLYQQLIAPVEDILAESKRIVIIPDGILGTLPFEALLTDSAEGNSLSSWPYWIREKTISYAFSATLWREMKQRQHHTSPPKSLLALAPAFQPLSADVKANMLADANPNRAYRKGNFSELIFAKEEVRNIHQLMGGDMLLGSSATLDAFTAIAHNYRILHLATHGKIGEDPRYSLLAFYGPEDTVFLDDTLHQGISGLYLADLYTLPLNADLVVLSACETGIGQLYRGEGMASLARGFTYAGAKSLVPSLWKVDDRSTAELMEHFYQYLSEGIPKDSALKRAKIHLIDTGQKPQHWAAFILMGDEAPIEKPNQTWIWWLLGLGFLFSMMGIVLWRRKKIQKI